MTLQDTILWFGITFVYAAYRLNAIFKGETHHAAMDVAVWGIMIASYGIRIFNALSAGTDANDLVFVFLLIAVSVAMLVVEIVSALRARKK